MARYHFWGFIVNEAGEPIRNAEVTVKLAGSDEIACLYYDEFGNSNSCTTPSTSAGPQLSTLSNGFYEFWIGDITERYGYRNDQKFKLEWIRIGVAHGEIDYIDIFPLGMTIEPMSITDCVSPSIIKNRLISDYFACKWDQHTDSVVSTGDTDFTSVHGLEFIRVDEMDHVPNKIVSNFYGWHWDHHRLSTVQSYHPSAGTPHGIEEVNPLDGDSILRNKVVSNRDLYNLDTRITNLNVYVNDADTNLQYQIDNLLGITNTSKSGWWTIYDEDWLPGIYNEWYVNIHHNLDIWYPIAICWDVETNRVIHTVEIEFMDSNTIKISIDNENAPDRPDRKFAVRIANGGIPRHP